jgi:hypothetical protein
LDEIKVTIVTCISNLGKSIDAGNEVDTAVLKLKSLRLAIALVVISTSVLIGSFLPPRVDAELELNSVNPPPDTVEEDINEVSEFNTSEMPFTLRSTQNVK